MSAEAKDWFRATLMAVAKDPACALDLEDGNPAPVVDLMVEAILVGNWLVHNGDVNPVEWVANTVSVDPEYRNALVVFVKKGELE